MTHQPTRTEPDASRRERRIRAAIWALLAAIVAVGIVWFIVASSGNEPESAPTTAPINAQLVRDNSHRVTAPAEEKAQLVEFLDFECESCLAAVPLLEELKAEYGDRVTFVHRYFPLPGHRNSGTSAMAVEAAAQQGKYEEMADRMFATQQEWGEGGESKAPLFRTYAEDLGLDMAAYDRAVVSESTRDRVREDVADGTALGVSGTPTFFLNGKMLVLDSEEQFRQLLADAVR